MLYPDTTGFLFRYSALACINHYYKHSNHIAMDYKDVYSRDLFEDRLKDVYRYEVQGGLQGINARQELNADGYSFQNVSSHVYVALTDEALWLASKHNANWHHNTTHQDYVD